MTLGWLALACGGAPEPQGTSDLASPAADPTTSGSTQCTERRWFSDADGDGAGDPLEPTVTACDPPMGHVLVGDDCDDDDPELHPRGELRFTDVTEAAGLHGVQWDPVAEPPRCTHEPMAAGAAAGDVDADGDIDLFVTRLYQPDALYLNAGDGTFEDEAAAAGVDHPGAGTGALMFDATGDGALDLLVTSVGGDPVRLHINAGDGTFTEQAAQRGVDLPPQYGCGLSFSASAGDIDGDGDLDLHLTAWQEEGVALNDRGRLFLNDGAGFFIDATLTAGVDITDLASFTSAIHDLDGDGDPELMVAADWGGSALFHNLGDGTFANVTATSGVGDEENGMGSAIADVDNDGDPDWFVTSVFDLKTPCPEKWGCSGNRLYRNDGALQFTDVTDAAGVRDGQWGWGAQFADFDLDGWLDLMQVGGFPIREFDDLPSRLWRNRGDGTFESAACDAGWVEVGQGRAVIPFDADDDGDLDVFVAGSAEAPTLWRNDHPAAPFLVVDLRDEQTANRRGIGARVEVRSGALTQVRWIQANSTYLATGPAEAWFALPAGTVNAVAVTWPDGQLTTAAADPSTRVTLSR